MKKALAFWFIVVVSLSLGAQETIPCSDCPPLDSYWCNLYPDACSACWESCGAPPPRRIAPLRMAPFDPYVMTYTLPKTIAVTQIAHEVDEERPVLQHFSNYDLAVDVSNHGFRALKVWFKAIPFEGDEWCWSTYWGHEICEQYTSGEDMSLFWRFSGLDVLVIRPYSQAWTWTATGDNCGVVCPEMALVDYYALAKRLYKDYWWDDKVIIITDWEQDWVYESPYKDFLLRIVQQRQLDVERARREAYLELHRRPTLRVYHAIIVNRYPNNNPDGIPTLAEEIPYMESKPDFIGLSYWSKGYDPRETLDWLRETTGYPPYRIYIDELGAPENQQVQRYSEYIPVLWDWGVRLICIWNWKTTWCDSNNMGLWKQVQPCNGKVVFGEPTDGYYELQRLNGMTHGVN
jgi:hypothetical protein